MTRLSDSRAKPISQEPAPSAKNAQPHEAAAAAAAASGSGGDAAAARLDAQGEFHSAAQAPRQGHGLAATSMRTTALEPGARSQRDGGGSCARAAAAAASGSGVGRRGGEARCARRDPQRVAQARARADGDFDADRDCGLGLDAVGRLAKGHWSRGRGPGGALAAAARAP